MVDHNDIPVQNADELDDVEGHGLREVAAAASIGAAVLGAGGAALAATNGAVPHPGPAPVLVKAPTIAVQAQQDATRLASDMTQGARVMAGQAQAGASTLTSNTLAPAYETTGSVTATTANAVAGSVRLTQQAELDAETLAGDAAASATSTTISVVAAVENKATNSWTLDVAIVGADVRGGGSAPAQSGTVTVVNDGKTVASAIAHDGKATLSFSAAGHSGAYTISYGPSSIKWPRRL